jgi:dTDP-glucose 4,6-dehydratase
MDAALPGALKRPHETLIDHVADRPGHDRRYALASRRLRDELGWTPRVSFADGLGATVRWYLDNREWWEPLRGAVYRGERLGLATGGGR